MTRSSRARVLGLVLALAGAGARARAAEVLAVLSSDSSHYRQAFDGFKEAWGSPVPAAMAGSVPPGRVDAIVAFGSRAALSEEAASPILVTCLAPGAVLKRETVIRVSLLPPADVLADRIKRLLPGLRKLRVLWSSDSERPEVDDLAAAGRARGFAVISQRVENPDALPDSVRGFSHRADALWLMPDPALVNAQNFATLREYAKAARVPFLAPTEGLAEKGATATLAVSFRDLGRAAADALKARLAGRPVGELVHSDRVVVTLNARAAQETGMDAAAAGGVDRRIP